MIVMSESKNPEEEVRKFWNSLGAFKSASVEYQYNMLNMLAGYLQACETFEHLSHEEAQKLFQELQ